MNVACTAKKVNRDMLQIIEEADLRAEVVKVKEVTRMPGYDRIELVWLYNKAPKGEPCIVARDKFNTDDHVVYIPPDHIVSDVKEFTFLEKHPEKLAPDEEFVRHKYRRVRAMKLREFLSHGLVLSMNEADSVAMKCTGLGVPTSLGQMVGENLGITRWYPRRADGSIKGTQMGHEKGPQGLTIPKYTLVGIRKTGDLFEWEDDISSNELVVTEKLHGCNARFVVSQSEKSHFRVVWDKFWDWVLRRLPQARLFDDGKKRLHIASRTVWRGTKTEHNSFWKEVAEKYALFSKLRCLPGFVFFGEIVGRRIQGGNFLYGTRNDTIAFYVFDIFVPELNEWVPWNEIETICSNLGLDTVPVLKRGRLRKDEVELLVDGISSIDKDTMREGVVIRTQADFRTPAGGRKIIKWKSEEFLQQHG